MPTPFGLPVEPDVNMTYASAAGDPSGGSAARPPSPAGAARPPSPADAVRGSTGRTGDGHGSLSSRGSQITTVDPASASIWCRRSAGCWGSIGT